MKITPEILLAGYARGLFPMAAARDAGTVNWYDADPRGILPLDAFHVPRRLARKMRTAPYALTVDAAFPAVIRACADTRADTWINDEIILLYTALHRQGVAHSAEAWEGDTLAGGVYGVALGGAFFGESMFTRRTDAGKMALVHLVRHLTREGFVLFDTQMVTPVTRQFGAIEIPREEYLARLRAALDTSASF